MSKAGSAPDTPAIPTTTTATPYSVRLTINTTSDSCLDSAGASPGTLILSSAETSPLERNDFVPATDISFFFMNICPIINPLSPPPPLHQFISKLMKRTQLSHSTLLHALFLLQKLRCLHPTLKSPRTLSFMSHRLFLGALIVSAKVLYDDTYDNQAWRAVAQGVCITVADVNRLESEFLGALKYDAGASISRADWISFCQQISSAMCSEEEQAAKPRNLVREVIYADCASRIMSGDYMSGSNVDRVTLCNVEISPMSFFKKNDAADAFVNSPPSYSNSPPQMTIPTVLDEYRAEIIAVSEGILAMLEPGIPPELEETVRVKKWQQLSPLFHKQCLKLECFEDLSCETNSYSPSSSNSLIWTGGEDEEFQVVDGSSSKFSSSCGIDNDRSNSFGRRREDDLDMSFFLSLDDDE
ncbi:hypothetical protein HDU82_008845 [Entophlyctis luteolus]|nr:hypothetical protein HDU82_008845 [Entophlyctis luteolus]